MQELEKDPSKAILPKLFIAPKSIKSKFVSKATQYSLDHSVVESIQILKPNVLTFDLEIQSKKVKLVLERVEIMSNYEFELSDGSIYYLDPDKVLTYRGYESDNRLSWATMTIIDGKVNVLIANEFGNFEINPDKTPNSYIGFYSKNSVQKLQFNDLTDEHTDQIIRIKEGDGSRIGNCLEVFIEADFSVYQGLGSSTTAVTNWIVTNMNNVIAVYALSDINMKVAANPVIWTTSDPYASSTALDDVRDAFVSFRQNNYNGRIAHLVSFRNLGGGIANGIGGYCASYPSFPGPQCVSTNLTGTTQTFPVYSFNTYVMSHEIGHVMGMRHTHACVWNNNLTQIDDCGNVFAANNMQTPEGENCFAPGSPILPSGGGTIMSNCNLLPTVGINLNLGFGPIVGAALRQNFAFATCSTGTCSGIAPSNDNCVDAFILPLRKTCLTANFLLSNATPSNPSVPSFQCSGITATNDIWFKVVAQSTSLTIETFQVAGGPTDLVMQAYKGASCNTSMTRIGCNDNKTSSDLHPKLVLTSNVNIGDTIKIRIVSKTNETGTFSICAYDNNLPCHPDYSPLMDFYNANGGTSWTVNAGWFTGAAGTNCNVCSYYGVTCNANERVISISLPNNNISGSSLPSSWSNLTYLNSIILNHNNISGNVPTSITTLPYLLTLDLGFNNLSGTIPGSLGNCASLKNLYLDHNNLSGSLPIGLTANNLNIINVQSNNLSGCFPVSYNEYCSKSYDFSQNPLLANGVSFNSFCATGIGIDNDGDTYCSGGLDCNDTNSNINPAIAEACDLIDNNCNGLIDDVTTPQVNSWLGGSGNWSQASNWSLGTVPARCTDVIISGNNGAVITIPSSYAANARSVTISAGRSLIIQNTGSLSILHGNNIINNGTLTNNGTINVEEILSNSLYGIHNFGTLNNQATGVINVINSGTRSIHNQTNATINNFGDITIDGNAFESPSNAIYNDGIFNNYKDVIILNITGTEVIIKPNSKFFNQTGGKLRLN
jgi:hypothetical protein